jgi:hypothetical protein
MSRFLLFLIPAVQVVQWLRLALSKGPKILGVSHFT